MQKSKQSHSNSLQENIGPNEILIRAIFSPDHVTENGEISISAIPSQDVFDHARGWSVHRKIKATEDIIQKNINHLENKKEGRKLQKIALIEYHKLQSIDDLEGQSAFFAKAAPLPDDESHAIVLCSKKYSKSLFLSLREKLIHKLYYCLKPEDIFKDEQS